MSIRRRPDSRFYQYRFKIDGIPYEGSTKQANPGKARQFESALMTRIREGGAILRRCPVLKDFAADFLAYVEKSQDLEPNTKRCYRNGWRLLSKTPVAKMRLNAIGPADAAVLTFPGGASNANQALRTLSVMLSYACEQDYLKARPKISLRKELGRELVVEPHIEKRLLEAASPLLRCVITIMLDCGMRPDEVSEMRWENVRWADSAIFVPCGKTRSATRYVPLSERMKLELTAQKARIERNDRRKHRISGPWVFPSPRSEAGHQTTGFIQSWARMAKGIEDLPEGLVLYSCRHTFATNFLKASGNDRAALKEIMGHSSFRVSERYLHPGVQQAAAIMDRFNVERGGLKLVEKRA